MAQPTTAQIKKHLNDRIKQFETTAKMYRKSATDSPLRSVQFTAKAEQYQSTANALGHVLYFVEHGELHPDLVVKPIAE